MRLFWIHKKKIIDQRRIEKDKVPLCLFDFNVQKVAMESSTAVAPLYRLPKKKVSTRSFLIQRRLS